MEKNIYEISKEGTKRVLDISLFEMKKNSSSAYIVDIQAHDRHHASQQLLNFGLSEEICNNLTEPSEHIRFEYFGETWYGELAYFSPQTKQSNFAGIIIHKNILIGIHHESEGILSGFIKGNNELTDNQNIKISPEFLLYVIILEVLSNYGKLVLSYREEIEELASELDKKNSKISPKDFLESKAQLSVFSRSLEKLFFTLSFPPVKDVFDVNNSYQNYFDYLLTNMKLIKTSLKGTEERLESLNDHYQLLLQAKANKRLNFLTIIQAVFVPLTLVVGIYGMNFVNMPELNYKYGYYISLGAMAFIASIFMFHFYRKGWFK